jgi:hypothetical protein
VIASAVRAAPAKTMRRARAQKVAAVRKGAVMVQVLFPQSSADKI